MEICGNLESLHEYLGVIGTMTIKEVEAEQQQQQLDGLISVSVACWVELISDRVSIDKYDRAISLYKLLHVLGSKTIIPSLTNPIQWWINETNPIESTESIELEMQKITRILNNDSTTTSIPYKMNSTIELDSINSFLKCTVQFKKPNTFSGISVPFQISLSTIGNLTLPIPLEISKMYIYFSNSEFDHCLVSSNEDFVDDDASGSYRGLLLKEKIQRKLKWIDCKTRNSNTEISITTTTTTPNDSKLLPSPLPPHLLGAVDLKIVSGITKIYECEMTPDKSQDVHIKEVKLVLCGVHGCVNLKFGIEERVGVDGTVRRKWAENIGGRVAYTTLEGYGELSYLRVIERQPNLKVSIQCELPALLQEKYSVNILATNEELFDMEAILNVEFKGTIISELFVSETTNQLMDDAVSDELLNISLGIIPTGKTITKTIFIQCKSYTPGERILTTIIKYKLIKEKSPHYPGSADQEFYKTSTTKTINFKSPFKDHFKIYNSKKKKPN